MNIEQINGALNQLSDIILSESFIKDMSAEINYEKTKLKKYLCMSIGEARHTLILVSEYELTNRSVLEFGAGLGLASIVLAMSGVDITSYEPGELSYEKNYKAAVYIKKYLELEFKLVNDLSKLDGSRFYLIFSNNVLYHVSKLGETLSFLHLILEDGGVMLHNTPNYLFPYDPHFRVFFFPFFPLFLSFVVPSRVRKSALWKSFNFVTYFDILKYAKDNSALLSFKKNMVYETLIRVKSDPGFGTRHLKLKFIIDALTTIRLTHLLKILPSFLNTPMVFEWRKQ